MSLYSFSHPIFVMAHIQSLFYMGYFTPIGFKRICFIVIIIINMGVNWGQGLNLTFTPKDFQT